MTLIPPGSIVAHAEGETYTVSFDPGTGTGSMAPVTVNVGEDYTLPECSFTHTNPERTFHQWYVGGELKDPGDTVTVNSDLTVTAKWRYTTAVTIDNSVDVSTTRVLGYFTLRDTGTGDVITTLLYEETAASAFTEPSNPEVEALLAEAQEALRQKADQAADEGSVTVMSERVSGPSIRSTADDRTYTYFDNGVDTDGDIIGHLLIIDGTYLHSWQYTVTLEAELVPGDEPAMSYLHILPGEGGSFTVDFEGKTSDDQPWGMPEGTLVTVTAIPDEGYRFKGWYKGDVNGSSYEEMLTDELLSSEKVYVFNATGYPYLCPVFEVDTAPAHPGDQVQMWVGNTEVVGPDSSAQGGKVAVKYMPSYDDYPEIKAKDGTSFVAGEILQFYKGDECTVYARPDEGYRFVGWYHVNIEWAPGETLAWEGEVISTETSFTYRPGVTLLPGDTEALRYVCAVFEEVPPTPATYTVTVANDGNGTGSASPSSGAEGTEITLTATPNEGYRFKEWQIITGDVTITDNKFTLGNSNVEVKAIFEEIPALPATYAIIFDANGGTGTMDSVIVKSGDNFTLPECDFIAPEGKEFDGWDKGAVGTAITITADTTIMAQWKDVTAVTPKYNMTEGENASWQKGGNATLDFIIVRTVENESAFSRFLGIEVDGSAVSEDNYTAESGRVKLSLKASYLETLSVGEHTLKVLFSDGSVETKFTITAANTPEKPADTTSPQTGDDSHIGIWIGLMIASFAAFVILMFAGKRRLYVGKHSR
ncbi:MAG: InlB B-repeat-containing protein [Firmicutes bacterium]|nr:InlB B-repeat-containing protein [Bacillota bacterium]